LAARRVIKWSQLRDQPLVAAGRDHERSVEQMRAGLPDSVRITPVDVVDNISTALGVAAQGLALTLSPAYVGVWAERMGLVMRRIVEPEVMRQVCIYRPTQRAISSASLGFAEFVEAALRGRRLNGCRAVRRRSRESSGT
jgi:DNA-binding transcriptional LysR family regulator